jgi:CcmD family protein
MNTTAANSSRKTFVRPRSGSSSTGSTILAGPPGELGCTGDLTAALKKGMSGYRAINRFAASLFKALLLGWLVFWQPAFSAHGQPAGGAISQPAAQGGDNTFRSVEGPAREEVPGGLMLVAAYGLVWLLLFLYVARVGVLQKQAQQELDRLEQRLNKARAPDQIEKETGQPAQSLK